MSELRLLARAMIDDETLSSMGGNPTAELSILALAAFHGVEQCLAWRLTSDAARTWSDSARGQARVRLAGAVVREELQRRELCSLTQALVDAGIPVLLMKGAAWAYLAYPLPLLRPRFDTDLLVRATDRIRAGEVVTSLGYEPVAENTSEMATAQRHYQKVDQKRLAHPVDLHWRVTNPLVFAAALPFDTAWGRSVGLDAVNGARTFCLVDALQLACLHRLAHHGDDSSLVWLYDIHCLAGRFGPGDWRGLEEQAALNGLAGFCLQGLNRANDLFGTKVSEPTLRVLAAGTSPHERAFLGSRVSPLGLLVSDWKALGTWSGKLRLLGAHVFPAPAYIESKYGTRNRALLPLLYAHRALAGLPRWLSLAFVNGNRAQGREQ